MADESRERALERALLRLCERWWHELGYRAERFRQMNMPSCKRYKGGVRAIEDVLTKSTSGFTRLRNHLNLTVEHLVLSGEWNDLIREEYRVLAGKRLAGESKVAHYRGDGRTGQEADGLGTGREQPAA